MRYYRTEQIGGLLFVVGEIVGGVDPVDESQYPHELADNDDSFTREELLELPGGRQALWTWERGDDSPYVEAYRAQAHKERVAEVRKLAAAGNPWARDLIAASLPERDVAEFARGDHAFADWGPQLLR